MFVTIIVIATLLILLGLIYYLDKKEQKEFQKETILPEFEIEKEIIEEIIVPEPDKNTPKPKPDILYNVDVEYFIRKTALDILKAELPYIPEYYLWSFERSNQNDSTNDILSRVDLNDRDPLFDEAARLIVIHQQGSSSLIESKFAIGFNRAGRLMDQLEAVGIVGPIQKIGPRNVLISDEYTLEKKLDEFRGFDYKFNVIKNRYVKNEDEVIEAIELRFFDKIEIEKSVITREIEEYIINETQERIAREQAELEEIKRKLLEKERKKALAKEAREQLISEGLIAPSKTTKKKKPENLNNPDNNG